jgi:multidrug efflux pump subunit AcrA (membrane-fusion protein)
MTIRLCLGAALAMMLAACGSKEKEAEPVVPVQVAPAIRGSIQYTITADAILYPRDQANIMPKVSAPVRRFLVSRGDHVKANQLLAVLENRDLVAAALEGRGQYGQAEANYRTTIAAAIPEQVTKAQADVEVARQALDAAQKVLESRQQLLKEGALARKAVDEALVAYTAAKGQFDTAQLHLKALQDVAKEAQVRAAAAQVEAAKGHYESAAAQLGYSEVRSPIKGVVTDRPLYPGEIAATGAPLMTVMDMSSVVARVNLPQEQAKNVKVGAEATITPSDGSEPVTGKVTVVSPAVDLNSTTVQVWVQAVNPEERLRAGTSVRVMIVAAEIDGAVLIPPTAVLPSDEGGTIVLTVDDKNVAHEKKVQIGVRQAEMVQVVDGVEPGERVITVGGLGLSDKAKVRILKPGEKRPGEEEEKKDDEK